MPRQRSADRGLDLFLRLVVLRPVVVIVPLIVAITMGGQVWLVGEKFFVVNTIKIFDDVNHDAY